MKSNLNLDEMAKQLGVSQRAFRQIVLELGVAQLQFEAERMQAIEMWDKGITAEWLILEIKPEIKHFKAALQNLLKYD